MTILILNWRDMMHPLSGGAEISLLEHAKYWEKKGNKIIWFSSLFSGAKEEEIRDGIHIFRKGSHYTVHLWALLYSITKKFGTVDIVIDSFHFIPFFTPFYISRKKIIGLINEVAGKLWFANLFYPFAFIGSRLEPVIIRFYKNCIFITGSNSTREELIKIGLRKNDITVVHHGIRKVKVPQDIKKERTPVLAFLGRVSQDKGIEEVVTAFVLVKDKIKSAQLWIIGKEEKPGMMDTLLKKVSSKEVKKSIKYVGFVSEKKKFELLKRAWILIHPSKKEGWGLNVIEAATQGTPTVGYDVEGLRDSVKNGKTGILVDPKNPYLLSESIATIISEKSKHTYTILSKNSLSWAKKFNWNISTKQSLDILQQVYETNNKK